MNGPYGRSMGLFSFDVVVGVSVALGLVTATACAPPSRPRSVAEQQPRSMQSRPSSLEQSTVSPVSRADSMGDIERRVGGRLGVYVLDTKGGVEWGHRADESFALCSTFKWALAAAILQRVDRGELSLYQRVVYGEPDLLDYAPFTREHVGEGALAIERLAEAAVTVSDNTAANLLLDQIGGPVGLTQFMRSLGDPVTRLDRPEPELNENAPGDVRDTTTPRAMVQLMKQVLLEDVLTPGSKELLLGWMRASTTGKNRLRAGLPVDWIVGDKTGSCARGAVNDVAIAWPPGRAPVLVAVYLSEGDAQLADLEAAHADVARMIAERVGAR